MFDLYNLILFLILLALGYSAGTISEKNHYRSILKRERDHLSLPAITLKHVDLPPEKIQSAQLVCGSAVISIDYFKRIMAALRNIFGGTITAYETLLDRARREAILRMKETAGDAAMIVNVRIETSTIGRKARKSSVGCLEAIAYGTAISIKQ